jgi:hypothetical protein
MKIGFPILGLNNNNNNTSSGKKWPPTLLSHDMDRIENDESYNSSIVACVFIAAVNVFTKPRCLAT